MVPIFVLQPRESQLTQSSYEVDIYSCTNTCMHSFLFGRDFFFSSVYNVPHTKDKIVNGTFFNDKQVEHVMGRSLVNLSQFAQSVEGTEGAIAEP